MLKLHALTERNEGGEESEESKDKKDSPSRIHESGRQRIAHALQSADANCKGSEGHQTNGRVAASEGAPAWYSVRSPTLARLSNGSGRVIPGLHFNKIWLWRDQNCGPERFGSRSARKTLL